MKIVTIFYEHKLDCEDNQYLFLEMALCIEQLYKELMSYKSRAIPKELKENIITSLIPRKCINKLLRIIKDYSQLEFEFKVTFTYRNEIESTSLDEALDKMIRSITFFLGEIIVRKYYRDIILDSLSRAYTFEGIRVRKTYLKELIEIYKMNNVRNQIESTNNCKIFNAFKVKFYSYDLKQEYCKIIVLREEDFGFLEGEIGSDEYEWNLTNFKIEEDTFKPIKYFDVLRVMTFEFENRVIIRSKKRLLNFFFYKRYGAGILKDRIKLINTKIQIKDKYRIFNLHNGLENSIFMSAAQCDAFSLMNFFFNEKLAFKNAKIIIFNNDFMYVLKEDLSKWYNFSFEEINNIMTNDSFKCEEFTKCYEEVKKISLDDLIKVKFVGVDEMELTFDDEVILLKLFDDISFIQLKRSIIKFIKKKKIEIEFEDKLSILDKIV